jgi:nicotinate-nucleotide adenylyltransferase
VKLGLFGGTFDPPHIGHLIVAQDAIAALHLDRVIFIPAGSPPHKRDRPVTAGGTRAAMLEAAVRDDPRFEVDRIEIERSGPSYSVDTAEALHARHPAADLFFLVGADQFREFRTWREPERLAGLVKVAIMSRKGVPPVADADIGTFGARYIEVTGIDISSTDIRRRQAAGTSIRYLVPPAVEAYLSRHPVYQKRS